MKLLSMLHRILSAVIATQLLMVVMSGSATAAINFPFQTTHNCAEQNQKSTLWITGQNICDGLRKHGDWTTNAGSLEQITTAANYSGGAGGRGQRHWVGNVCVGCGTDISGGIGYSFNQIQEFWLRWYARWEAGLRFSPNLQEEKIFYMALGACGNSVGCHIDMQGDGIRVNVGTGYGGTYGWNQIFGGGPFAASDGRWICLEAHLKNETNNAANDGVFQFWVDGVLRTNRTDVDYRGSTGFSYFGFPDNASFDTQTCCGGRDMYEDRDDVVMVTSGGPIGCLSTPTTPSAPSGFKIASLFPMFIPFIAGMPLFGFVAGRLGRKE